MGEHTEPLELVTRSRTLKPGDRVRWSHDMSGRVEHVDGDRVLIRWDDRRSGWYDLAEIVGRNTR